ncbi:MAG: serine/threonine protein kinase [Myxococcales bacterium]|nr:serine/threonine protein kinase [Myxococcales bacterium]
MSARRAGEVIDGRYALTARLGEGTFGDVWRARDRRFNRRDVAVKLLKREYCEESGAVGRFLAESEALLQLDHASVVAVLDRGVDQGQHYIVTEFIDGAPLSQWIEARRNSGRAASLAEAMPLIDGLCAGVEAAHAVRAPGPIVHRDLKPENVMVVSQGDGDARVKVLDFGIAQLGQRQHTRTGAVLGTLVYMAPEQAMGQVDQTGPWSDVFSLAVIAVEMLTLCQLSSSEGYWWARALRGPHDLRARLEGLSPSMPEGLREVLVRGLAAEAGARYADAGAFRRALRQAAQGASWVPAAPRAGAGDGAAGPSGATAGVAAGAVRGVGPGATLDLAARETVASRGPSIPSMGPRARRWPWALAAGATAVLMAAVRRRVTALPTPAVYQAATAQAARLPVSASSASSYIGNGREQFAPQKAFDGDLATAWNESEPGHGVGSWIEARFATAVRLERVTLSAGFDAVSNRHGDLFYANAHIKRLRLRLDGGVAIERDVGEHQRSLTLSGLNVTTRSLRVEVLDVWPGTRWADLSISEISAYGRAL